MTRERLEQDVEILRTMIETAMDHHQLDVADACASLLADRLERLEADGGGQPLH